MQGVFTVMRNQTWFSDVGQIEQSNGFNADYTGINSSSPCSISSLKPSSIDAVSPLQLGRFNEVASIDISEITSPVLGAGSGYYDFQKGNAMHEPAHGDKNEQFESMGESGMGETSHHTDTSMEVDADDKNQFQDLLHGALISVDSVDKSNEKKGDEKSLRRLAQNREAARKSRLRKKAYVQQLESSRLKLNQLEQELQQARQQGMFISSGCLGDQSRLTVGSGAMAFDVEYARWLEEHQRQINDLRSAVNSNVTDNDLRLLVDGVMSHYDEVFRLKSMGAKYDVFHMLSGMWTTPAERCFMWLGGFRSSELLRILGDSLEPLTDQQLMNICNLQQSSQQAEDALSQGMEALQQSLAESLSGSISPSGSANVANYMSQMAVAMGKLGTLENFLHQADLLRQQTLRQMYRILTTRQAARALLVISDYFSRLRALSSLWLARSRN